MSAISSVRLKECKIKLTRLTTADIEKYTGKTFEEAVKIVDLNTDVKPMIFVRKDITDVNKDIKTTQDTEGTSNTGHEIEPDITLQNDDRIIKEETNEQVEENMHAGFDDFFPSIYQPYVYNEMETTEGNANIHNPEIGYIPNTLMIKQEIQDDSYDTYMPEVAGSSQVTIKQEIIDESYNYNMYSTQEGLEDVYSPYYSPAGIEIPTQNFGMQSINPGPSNPHIMIKQEVFDEGNIEVFTDVLRPSADQGYEDGRPW